MGKILNHQCVYLVDDDEEDRELFSEALSGVSENTNLIEIPSGVELLKILNCPETPKPDVIFLDVNMPKLNGLECLKKIKSSEEFKDVKVVMLSTYGHSDYVSEAMSNGASQYYVKPTRFDSLKKIISGELNLIQRNYNPRLFT